MAGAVATGFNNVFGGVGNVDAAAAAALGATIEDYVKAPYTQANPTNANASPTSAPSGFITRFLGKEADANQIVVLDSFGGVPKYSVRRANGTTAAPTAVALNNVIGAYCSGGYYTSGGTGYQDEAACIKAVAAENWTATAQGTRLDFYTTPTGSNAATRALSILGDNSVAALGPLGYLQGAGVGGAVTQAAGARTNGVTLNTLTGTIQLCNAAGSTTGQTFVLTNSKIGLNDTLVFSLQDASVTVSYAVTARVAAGSARITVTAASAVTEAPIINFAVIRGSAN